jgi:hypothetical protein
MKIPELTFDFYKVGDQGNSFKFGKLYLRTKDKYLKFHATSGLPNYQQLINCGQRGRGGIPPCEMVNILTYTVSTKPIPMPKLRGVEGNFYQIFPHLNQVKTSSGVYTRGDFGIHQDAGILGTAGCIGITKGMHWKAFQMEMQSLVTQGFEKINLFVPVGY